MAGVRTIQNPIRRIPHLPELCQRQRCTSHKSAGGLSSSFEKALARHFQPSQAISNPAAFAAAAQLLITILTDAHPQLLQLLHGSAVQQEADKVCKRPSRAAHSLYA